MKLQLCAISGSREGQTFVVEDHKCVSFGRTAASDIAFLEDGHMSSLHFEVVNHGDRFEVRDCGSTNGTWLNNNRITVTEISHGDLLKAGKSVLRVELARVEHGPRDAPPSPIPVVEPPTWNPPPVSQRVPTHLEKPKQRAPSPIQFSMDGDSEVTTPPKPYVPNIPRTGTGNTGPVGIGSRSPIESVLIPTPVVPPSIPSGMPPASGQLAKGTNASNNPFTDSCDFGFQQPPPVLSDPKLDRPGSQARGFFCLERKIQATIEEAFALVLAKLMANYSMRLIVHFQKIRIGVPGGIADAEPLFDWFGRDAEGTCSPVMLKGDVLYQPEFSDLLPRLCRADALLAFFGTEPKSLESQIKSMFRTGIAGFSEEGGFLASCWPSAFMTLVDVSGNPVCEQLFAKNIAGTIFCTPGKKQVLRAYANSDMTALLKDTQFTEFV